MDASIPIIRLWHTLLVPVQGDILDAQAERLASDVLHEVQITGAHHLIIDLSGVAFVDSHLCMVVANLSRAARFMGCSSAVTGLTPEIAMTLESMGLNVGTNETMRSLEDALEALGIGPHRERFSEEDDPHRDPSHPDDPRGRNDDDLVVRTILAHSGGTR